ncbi:hypothetical protein OOT46_12170 [Aquabacterium sp. A7-Y]|uniref:hypothetical protein n=1 Tax=Aquabacterium sp. A7-Y TaxID=1349605 RepID=UPI00223D728F|nr:hypothetical protein [Aquabacterium sp. A7-Y]MCW7538598.1 hypothetical protein [Aquabacterium sp. A7-Y]
MAPLHSNAQAPSGSTERPPSSHRKARRDENHLLVSYLTLRKAVGTLGMLLPALLVLGEVLAFRTARIQESISSYYYTGMRDVFVGTMCALGVFLFTYRGYDERDNRAGKAACAGAIGLALCPTTPALSCPTATTWSGYVHLGCASLFFLSLAYFSLFLFTETDDPQRRTPQKIRRNRVYRTCGVVMLGALAALLVYQGLLPESLKCRLSRYSPVFWLESVAIVAFGVSWFAKGEGLGLMRDPREPG